jgi:4'-phosphopantetheinyl transferase
MHLSPTIYPVILPVPDDARNLDRRQRVHYLSHRAREALKRSAERMQIELGSVEKDSRGAPLPFQGYFWSLTHKPDYVGGVIAPCAVGMDLEKIRSCSAALFRRIATGEEWALASRCDPEPLFFRYWTAKEAVLKTAGEGIADLSRCKIRQVVDETHLLVDYAGQSWGVEQVFFDGHVAAVAGRGVRMEWTLPK